MVGGRGKCGVFIWVVRIGSPIVSDPDVLVVMNLPSLDKYEDSVVSGGKIFVDSSLVDRKVKRDDVDVYYIPATKIAEENGIPTLANMIITGKVIKELDEIPYEHIEDALKKVVSARHLDMLRHNFDAVQKGYDY